MYRPYVITSPPWETTSGGVRVMYGLYGALLMKGQVVFLNQRPTTGDCIGIYPEIEHGNPANASTVVRYILNKPGVVPAIYDNGAVKKGPTQFDSNDKLYYFSRLFGEANKDHYLFLPILNTHIFKDQGKQRTKTAYFVGKGINYDIAKSVHPKDSILITRDLAQDQEDLADLLNECQVLYCYDPVTAMTEIARLCGCRVVIINPVYTKEEFMQYEPGMNGISWGDDQGVVLDTKGFRSHYTDLKRTFGMGLDRLIEETQKG